MEFYRGEISPLTPDEQERLANQVITDQDDPWKMVVDAYRIALLKDKDPVLVEALKSGLENAFGGYLPKVIRFFEEKNKQRRLG